MVIIIIASFGIEVCTVFPYGWFGSYECFFFLYSQWPFISKIPGIGTNLVCFPSLSQFKNIFRCHVCQKHILCTLFYEPNAIK